MSLIEIWRGTREQVEQLSIRQILAISGEGVLRDDSEASLQLRSFLREIPGETLVKYCNECLTGDKFDSNGFVLQDIVNEVALRLGFKVDHGRYHGKVNSTQNYDGIWTLNDGWKIIVEVKAKDNFKIELSKLIRYRDLLLENNECSVTASSILIVIGNEETEELEAQIRGSRYAWDIRVLGIKALLKLFEVYQSTNSPEIPIKTSQLLKPHEFTRVDEIIDIVFTTIKDSSDYEVPDIAPIEASNQDDIEGVKLDPANFHLECIRKIEKHLGVSLVKERKTSYHSSDSKISVVLSVSKYHEKLSQFWFGFRDHFIPGLEKSSVPYVAFGCGSKDLMFLIPFVEFKSLLPAFHRTERESGGYYHIQIKKSKNGFILRTSKGNKDFDITKYRI